MKNPYMKNKKEMRKGLFWVTVERKSGRAMSNTTFCLMPRWMLILSLLTIALLAVLPTMANAAPVVINGDFEYPDVSMYRGAIRLTTQARVSAVGQLNPVMSITWAMTS